jgi:hypothetical protein
MSPSLFLLKLCFASISLFSTSKSQTHAFSQLLRIQPKLFENKVLLTCVRAYNHYFSNIFLQSVLKVGLINDNCSIVSRSSILFSSFSSSENTIFNLDFSLLQMDDRLFFAALKKIQLKLLND